MCIKGISLIYGVFPNGHSYISESLQQHKVQSLTLQANISVNELIYLHYMFSTIESVKHISWN